MFLEKTPHNLLNPRFFNRLFPEARYVHVVRDPRAIAVSLLAQTWGPSDLAGTCECVAAYLETWQSALQFLRETGLPVLDLRIEDLSRDTKHASDRVQAFLSVNESGDIFRGASEAVLHKWLEKIDEVDRKFLDDRLCKLAYSLGY